MSKSKRYLENFEQVTNEKNYVLDDAVKLLSSFSKTKFDETIDLSINLGVDPRHADQIVRGTVSLPHGTGKQLKVLVIAKGDKVTEAI
jgi:large subunit ribosomal protein L1